MTSATALRDVSIRVSSVGFAFVPRLRPLGTSLEAFDTLGQIDHLSGLKPIQELKPKSETDSTPNTYSGNFGLGAFPFHSDMAHWPTPPRFLALRCIRGAANVMTRLLDTTDLVEVVGASRLKKTLVKPRRPLEMASPLMRLLESRPNGRRMFRWDSIFMVAASQQSISVFDEVQKWIATWEPIDWPAP